MDMSKYREMFLSEAKEHLRNMSRQLVLIEKDPSDREGIDALFREAHSIKGMAASMGYMRTAELSHHLEDLMDGFRKGGAVPPAAVDRMLAGIDLLEGLLEDLETDREEREVAGFLSEMPPPAPKAPTAPAPDSPRPPSGNHSAPPKGLSLTVELAADAQAPAARALLVLRELGGLGQVLACEPGEERLRHGGEVHRLKIRVQTSHPPERLRGILSGMTDVARVTISGEGKKVPSHRFRKEDVSRTLRVRTDLLDQFITLTGELITNRHMLQAAFREERWSSLGEGLERLSRLISDLHHHVLKVRMIPLGTVTERLPRLVRDLARSTGKQVALRLEGEEVHLDRAILEELTDPLVHLVRNAVDHGIDKKGEIVIRAWREKDLVQLEVADNGKGLDPEAIRRKAVEKGLLSPAMARTLRERDVLQMICYPGFSTAARVTQTSGRGVGMDIVKSTVESLGGTLEIDSARGRGTRFLLKLPLSVAIIQILLVECAGHILGIPVTRIWRNLEIGREEIQVSGRRMVVCLPKRVEKKDAEEAKDAEESEEVEMEKIPLLSLRKILNLPGRSQGASFPIVVTEHRGRKVGLVVDRLAGQQQAFIQTLTFPLDRLGGVSGATILGSGQVVFIIDPQILLDERLTPAGGKP
jgi:two-component system chemotaxis sensor kinase CheA